MSRLLLSVIFCTAMLLSAGVSAYAATMDAGVSLSGAFLKSWTDGHPDVTTVTALDFKTAPTANYYMTQATGDFVNTGDYTMDTDLFPLQYVGHIGGSTSILSIGNQSFNPNGNGKDFLTWFVDVPSQGTTDKIHFDITSEQIVQRTTTGGSKNLTVYLLGNVWDDLHHWESSLSSLNLTVSQSISSGSYSWAATFSSPPDDAPPGVPEPSTMLLLGLGLGLTLITANAVRLKTVNKRV